MNYKDIFSAEEWETLKVSIACVFNHIADTDDKIDKKEKTAFLTFKEKSTMLPSVLLRQVIGDIPDAEAVEHLVSKSSSVHKECLRKTADLLSLKLERQDAVDYKKHLLAFGYFVASSSGSLFDHKVSHDEEDAMNEVGFALGISLKEMIQAGEIQELLVLLK